MKKTKTLIFFMGDPKFVNGGILWIQNLLENLTKIPDMDFVLVNGGLKESQDTSCQHYNKFMRVNYFLPCVPIENKTNKNTNFFKSLTTLILNIVAEKYFFLVEREAGKQKTLDDGLVDIVARENPEIILINDIWSALCVPSVFSLGVTCCLITLNDELAFHREYRTQNCPIGEKIKDKIERFARKHGNLISQLRYSKRVSSIFRKCSGIVALTASDLPSTLPDHIARAVLPPIFDKHINQWSYHGGGSVLFVGNISHYPNRLAIQWICLNLAPQLFVLNNSIALNIIGASSEDVPSEWKKPNVNFIGIGSPDTVIQHMTTDDFFVAPISNRFGAKLKLAQCASHGMPFIATREALSGLPFLHSIPLIELDKPEQAASSIAEYINNPNSLKKLSSLIRDLAQQAYEGQTASWKNFFSSVLKVRRVADVSSGSHL